MRVTIRGADDALRTEVASVDAVEPVEDTEYDLVLTVGEEALSAYAAREEPRPVLPAEIDAAWSPDREQLPELCGRLADRELPTVEARPLVVSVDGAQSVAVFDTTLITAEPARISEYKLSAADREHATFRADGVVVASPLGSHGYARAAGGPKLDFGTGLAVVPIAPFATIADTWVLQPPLSVSVERDDPVAVFGDSTQLAEGRSALTVAIETGRPLSVIDLRRL